MFARRAHTYKFAHDKQRGAALMVMLVVMVIGSLAFLANSLNRAGLSIELNQDGSQILARTKEVLLGNIISGIGGQDPGYSLRPDSFASTESPYNYDGTADGGCLDASKTSSTPILGLPLVSSGANMRCLGRLPWKDYSMPIPTSSENDPLGILPWYAVSANLVDPANVIFNSDLLNANPPLHPWLTVRDMNGNILSSRVAFVLILPNNPLSSQSRPASPNLGGANQYLDSITVPVGCTAPCVPGTYRNSDLDDDFIMGDEYRWITDPNNNAKKIMDRSYKFNDKLIYVTIDELMPLVEKRVGGEMKKILNTYFTAWGNFPYAATFTDPSISSYTGQISTYNGLLPIGNIIMPTWENIPTVTITGGGSLPDCELRNGSNSSGTIVDARWRCGDTNAHPYNTTDPRSYISIPAGKKITISGTLNDVGKGLWRPHNINSTTEVLVKDLLNNTVLASTVLNNVSITNTLNQDSSATVVFSAIGKSGGTTLRRIELREIQNYTTPIVPAPTVPVTPTPPAVIPAWLQSNNWHKLAYYAASQGYSPGSANSCGVGLCLGVNGQGGGSNIRAVVVMSSNRLPNQSVLPADNLGKYFEGENAIPNLSYENQNRSSIFNDQVITVEP